MTGPTRKRFRKDTLAKVRQVGRTLPEGGEWGAFLLLDTPGSFDIVPLVGMDGHDALPVLSGLIVDRRARLAARIQGAWLRNALTGEREAEVVMVLVADATGLEGWRATVERPEGRGPSLGPWQSAEASGPIAESMRAALQAASEQN